MGLQEPEDGAESSSALVKSNSKIYSYLREDKRERGQRKAGEWSQHTGWFCRSSERALRAVVQRLPWWSSDQDSTLPKQSFKFNLCGQGTGPHAAAKTRAVKQIKNKKEIKQKSQITLRKKKIKEQQYRRWGFRMLAASWANGLLPVTKIIGKFFPRGNRLYSRQLEQGDEPWVHRWTHQHADTRNHHKRQGRDGESSKEGIKNPGLTPRGKPVPFAETDALIFWFPRSPEWVVEPLLLRWCGAWRSQKMPGVTKNKTCYQRWH